MAIARARYVFADERMPADFECCEREVRTARFSAPLVADELTNERDFAALRTATVNSGMARLMDQKAQICQPTL